MKSKFGKSAIALTASTLVGFTALPAQSALLVSSSSDNSIKQYDENTGAYIRDFVTSGSGGLLNPQGLTLGANGNLFVSSSGTNSLKEYSGTSGAYIRDLVSPSGGILAPQGLTSADDGSLFVVTGRIPGTERDAGIGMGLVTFDSGVVQYDIDTGAIIKSINTGTSSLGAVFPTGPQPIDVAIGGPDNNLFLSLRSARFNSGGINEYDPDTGNLLRGLPLRETFLSPGNIAVGDRDLFYTEFATIGRIDLATGLADRDFISDNELNGATGITIGANGNLFVSDSTNNSVKQYDGETGNFLGDFISSGSGGLSSPTYLTTANVPVPEPSSVLGVLALGGLFAGGAVRRKRIAKLQK